jgi:hypothetical protein
MGSVARNTTIESRRHFMISIGLLANRIELCMRQINTPLSFVGHGKCPTMKISMEISCVIDMLTHQSICKDVANSLQMVSLDMANFFVEHINYGGDREAAAKTLKATLTTLKRDVLRAYVAPNKSLN